MFCKLELTSGYAGPNCTVCQGFCNSSNYTWNMSSGCITFTTITSGEYFWMLNLKIRINWSLNHKRDSKDSGAIFVSQENVSSLEEAFQENVTNYKTYISGQSYEQFT